jgi:hypothetical protein
MLRQVSRNMGMNNCACITADEQNKAMTECACITILTFSVGAGAA